jgi:alkanesulfonate monooxygenase SsuD/methylene tetrahydromethanopterin reductase-like flavin-dependent oxidoreductase (luciferase family)
MSIRFGSGMTGGIENVSTEAKFIEDLGYHNLSTGEHVRGSGNRGSMSMPVLGVAAGATKKIRLLSGILYLPLYHPVMASKLATTLDVASHGRLDLGIGVGGEHPTDFSSLEIPIEGRGRRSNESLEILRKLWTEENVTYEGEFFKLDDVTLLPKPTQTPSIPIWVAGRQNVAMRRAVNYGDGWFPYFYSPERYKTSFDYIVNYANDTGRNLDGFEWAHYTFISLYETREKSAEMAAQRVGGSFKTGGNIADIIGKYTVLGPVESAIERIQEYIDAGANHFMFNWMCDPADAHDQMKLAAEKILPHFS